MEQVCGEGNTKIMAVHSYIDKLAALHYFHWCDKSLSKKYPYLKNSDWYENKNEESYLTQYVKTSGLSLGVLIEDGEYS